MSSAIGSTVYRRKQQQFLGTVETSGNFSDVTSREIDLEVRRIINDCYAETEKLLRSHNRLIHDLAEVLLINETVDAEEMGIVMRCYLNTEKSEKSTIDEQNKLDKTEEIPA
jgi:cell division protease FtsH